MVVAHVARLLPLMVVCLWLGLREVEAVPEKGIWSVPMSNVSAGYFLFSGVIREGSSVAEQPVYYVVVYTDRHDMLRLVVPQSSNVSCLK